MGELVKEFQRKLNEFVGEKQGVCYMTSAKELQQAAAEEVTDLLAEAGRIKREAISDQNEDAANAMLAFEEILKTLQSELRMWVALKNDEPHKAWDYLIGAQNAACHSVRAHLVGEHMERYGERLETLEDILFPPQVFSSPGMVIRKATCSICGTEYGECSHVKGRPYMGEFCARMIEESEFTDISLVDDPADKRCIVTSFARDGTHWVDRMTFREIDRSELQTDSNHHDGQETSQEG